MACEISISKKGQHLFSTEIFPFRRIDHFQRVFELLNTKFPENKGFDLEIRRFPHHMPAISREDFRTACGKDNWRDILDLFILEEELETFRASKRLLDFDEGDAPENSSEADTLKAMFGYEDQMVILQYGEGKPRFIVPGDTFFETEDLATAEKECYRLLLRITDRVPLEES